MSSTALEQNRHVSSSSSFLFLRPDFVGSPFIYALQEISKKTPLLFGGFSFSKTSFHMWFWLLVLEHSPSTLFLSSSQKNLYALLTLKIPSFLGVQICLSSRFSVINIMFRTLVAIVGG